MGSVEKVLLLLVVGISILGLSTEGYVIPVQGVTNYSLRRVILSDTSRAYTRVRNRITVLTVVKTSHSYVILDTISRACIRARNHTPVLFVVKTFHGNLI